MAQPLQRFSLFPVCRGLVVYHIVLTVIANHANKSMRHFLICFPSYLRETCNKCKIYRFSLFVNLNYLFETIQHINTDIHTKTNSHSYTQNNQLVANHKKSHSSFFDSLVVLWMIDKIMQIQQTWIDMIQILQQKTFVLTKETVIRNTVVVASRESLITNATQFTLYLVRKFLQSVF